MRLVAIEMVHGSAGSTPWGITQNLWAPKAAGRDFDLGPSSLKPLEPFRDDITIISNTDVRNAEAFTLPEIGGDHFRSSAVFLTQMHPKQTQGSDVFVGTSLDQLYARRFGQDTPIPSMQLCIENVDQSGGCSYGYSCTYTDSISWASPNSRCRWCAIRAWSSTRCSASAPLRVSGASAASRIRACSTGSAPPWRSSSATSAPATAPVSTTT